nr:MAG TPA: hypothetical protein [Caudoviricetes sp.]
MKALILQSQLSLNLGTFLPFWANFGLISFPVTF